MIQSKSPFLFFSGLHFQWILPFPIKSSPQQIQPPRVPQQIRSTVGSSSTSSEQSPTSHFHRLRGDQNCQNLGRVSLLILPPSCFIICSHSFETLLLVFPDHSHTMEPDIPDIPESKRGHIIVTQGALKPLLRILEAMTDPANKEAINRALLK